MALFVDTLITTVVNVGDAILDAACGTGFAARAASVTSGLTGRVVGSDLNADTVDMARSVPRRGGSDIIWLQTSALDLPFSDDDLMS